MNSIYISDTNIWIDFRNAGLLESLFSLPFKLCCTDFVLVELEDFDVNAMRELGLLVLAIDEMAMGRLGELIDEHNNSSLADVSCYYLAKEHNYPLLTGDGQLRKQALRDGLTVHGALWLLDQLIEEGVISKPKAHAALTFMLKAKARLPKAECEHRLDTWRTFDSP